MTKELICIVCPLGCTLTATVEEGKVTNVSGNTCPRGKAYAQTECISPMRTVTSTVICDDRTLCSVKTDKPIPKEKMLDCIKIINNSIAHLPISVGDVIISNVFGSNIISTQNKR